MIVREIEQQELEQVAALETEIFSDAWSYRAIEETFSQERAWLIGLWNKEELAGYIIFYSVLDEGEIARIAVKETYRRQGAARKMLEGLFAICKERGVQKIMLEVRAHNEAAIACYKSCGFVEDGIRKNYYAEPAEDGLLMSLQLGR